MLSTVALAAALTLQIAGPLPHDTLPSGQADVRADAIAALEPAAPSQPIMSALFRPSPSLAALMVPVAASHPTTTLQTDDAPQLIEYSDAYFKRLTVHKWASYLTVPLFVGQYIVGQKLINGEGTPNLRGVHGALGAGIGGLFVVNTITGGLNAIEARKDPAEKNRRTLHSVLMLLADAGFVATGMLANERENEGGFFTGTVSNDLHRRVALASMGTALLSYAIMLPPLRRN